MSAVLYAIPLIQKHEGCRLEAYPDPLTGGEPWTIGWGSTGDGIGPGVCWTQDQADTACRVTINKLWVELFNALPWVGDLDDVREAVLLDMAYNLGIAGLLGFVHALTMIKAAQYDEAATAMLASRWATQVPSRAQEDAQIMRSGVIA